MIDARAGDRRMPINRVYIDVAPSQTALDVGRSMVSSRTSLYFSSC